MRKNLTLTAKSNTALVATLLPLVRTHLRIDGNDQDVELQGHIQSAIQFIETETSVDYTSTQWVLQVPCFPVSDELLLPRSPLISVQSVKYYDEDNVLQTVEDTNYRVVKHYRLPGYVEFDSSYVYPATYDRSDAVQVAFTSGYSTLDYTFAAAVAIYVAHAYEDRQGEDWKAGLFRLIDQFNVGGYN